MPTTPLSLPGGVWRAAVPTHRTPKPLTMSPEAFPRVLLASAVTAFPRYFATKSSKEGAASLGSISHAAILGSSPTKSATKEKKVI